MIFVSSHKVVTPHKVIAWIALLLSLSLCNSIYAQSFKPEELRVSFLYYIAHYTTFPNTNFDGDRFNFCFLEVESKSHSEAFESLPKKNIQEREINIIHLQSSEIQELEKCQLLFINKTAESKELFEKLKTLNETVVSIGETRSFIENGGLLTIVPLQSKMKIFFSKQQFENTTLKFSSLLLKRAIFR